MGITFPQPSTTAQEQLLARLNDEKTADALNRLLDRLEVVAFVAEALDGFLGRANVVADSVAASMADLRKMAGDSGTSGVVDSIPKLAKAGVKLADATDNPAFNRLMESGLLEKLGDEGKDIHAYFVSIDPERDTPQVMNAYVSNVSSRIVGVTGSPDRIAAMAKSFGIYSRKVEQADGDYTMDHTASVLMLDRKGAFAGTIAYGEDADTAIAKLKRLAAGA